MKKIILGALLVSSLVVAADEEQIRQEMDDVKAQIKALNESLKKLHAQLPKDADEKGFVTHTELGYITTSGNTNTETLNLDASIKKNWRKHSLELSLLMQYGTEDDLENKNKLLSELSYNYKFTKRLAFVYLVGYKEDKFSGYEYQLYTGPGAKYKAIQEKNHKLSLEGNVLYSVDAIEDTYHDGLGNAVTYPYPAGSISNNDGDTKSYASYRAKVVYDWQIFDNLKFNETLSYRAEFSDMDNYFAYSKTTLSSKLSDIFSAGVGYQVDYINKPADGKTSTDKTFTFNLIIDY
ncbi:DUF481 domain-containing protein [Sulfurimonas sp.]|uniref:DUF481 domain-containing protein n=1 Tax=Sulfurimonas sp. TaxID=2022749 RepID=UPI00262FD91B|nr:DUF481 domain-containing protein [Sulfurimonas sp.]MCW8894576.1 DUF481 domain-containing protein [Sulfurimonas sp.]